MNAVPAETGEVTALTLDGHGVVAPGGKRVLVPGALTGEQIRFNRSRRRRNYDEGALVEVLRPSPDRVIPPCEYFGSCGGCSLQHLSAGAQLEMKGATLAESLQRIGGVTPERVLPHLRGAVWGYRRRARLAARWVEKKGRVLVGFREQAKPWVVDMQSCKTVHPAISALLAPLSTLLSGLSIRARVPQVEATVADNAVALVIRVLDPPNAADRVALLAFEGTHGVRLYLQPGDESTVQPLGAGWPDELHYELPDHDLSLEFGPTDFIQVHAEINRGIVRQALELLRPSPEERALDLYCGIGNFTLPLARRTASVLGIEGAGAALQRAARSAAAAGIDNVRFVQADLAGAGASGAWTRERFDLVLLDPPRSGALDLMAPISATGARRILYVSCHPGTLARDAGVLVRDHGYVLRASGIMDMFPQTSHVESMALFERG